MMKKSIALVLVGAFLSVNVAPGVFAQTTTPGPTGPASATVQQYLEFSLKKVVRMSVAAGDINPFTQGTDVSSSPDFSFGTLQAYKDTDGKFLFMRGEYFYYVLMIAATSGRRYKITESGSALSGSGTTLPQEAVLLFPDYQWQDKLGTADQGAPPDGAYVGPVTSATKGASVENLIYQSGSTPNGKGRLVRAVLAISGPAAPIPPATVSYPFNYSLGYNGAAGQGTKNEYTSWKPVTQDQPSGPYTGTITFTLTLN
ncbi:MAG: hypothetical protein V1863_02495 [Candidatus Omnitrophota bacterium]